MDNDTLDKSSYFLSILAGLSSSYLIQKSAPFTPSIVKFFLVPFVVIYVTSSLLNLVFPHLNQYADKVGGYMEQKALGHISQTSYINLYPPLFAVAVIFIVLLYNRNLG
jgi:hypothetical protein